MSGIDGRGSDRRAVLIFYPTLRTQQERSFWTRYCAALTDRGYEPIAVSFLRASDDFALPARRVYLPTWRNLDKTPGYEAYGDTSDELLQTFFASEHRAQGFESLLEMAGTTYAYFNGLPTQSLRTDSPRWAGYRRSALVYVHYLMDLIRQVQPALVVVNNETHPLHLLARLCGDAVGVPGVHSERSPTVSQWFEPVGFYRDSEIEGFMADGAWRQPGPHQRRGRELVEDIRRAPAGHRATGELTTTFVKSGSRPRIFLPLDHALATGWSLPSHPLRLHNYPILSTPEAAVEHFAGLAERLGAELWVKAHPSEQPGAGFVEQARRDPRITLVEGGVEEPVLTADVIVSFLTKVAPVGLALNKAVVTVGPNPAAVSGLTYHAATLADIEDQLRLALAHGARPNQQTLIGDFLGYLDEQFFVANDLSNPGARRFFERYAPRLAPATPERNSALDETLNRADPMAPDVLLERPGLVCGPYSRRRDRRVEEVSLVEALFQRGVVPTRGDRPVMFDVGACVGAAHQWFAKEGWKVHAFEPNPPMHQRILDSLADGVTLNQLAVSDKSGDKVDFFTSEESIGISSMMAFRDSHRPTATVETIRLDDYVRLNKVDHIDFLKVDTEGFDLFVLKGLDWDDHAPSVVVCEFEDNKTRKLDYALTDLTAFLKERGYQIFISEWHPITRYGAGEHRWRAIHNWPCELLDPEGWGNIIAFRTPIPIEEMRHSVNFAVGHDFSERASKGKLKIPAVTPSAQIPFGSAVGPDVDGFHRLESPGAANWLGLRKSLPVGPGDVVQTTVTFLSAGPARLRISVGRSGKSPYEGRKHLVEAVAGRNQFSFETRFTQKHDGVQVQVAAADDAIAHVGALEWVVRKTVSVASDRPSLVYYPVVDNEPALQDLVARAAWFLSFSDFDRIVIPLANPALAGLAWETPDGMDPAVADRYDALRERLEFAVAPTEAVLRESMEQAAAVLCWRLDDCAWILADEKAKAPWLRGKKVWRVDPRAERNEGGFYIEASYRFMSDREAAVSHSKARFDAIAARIGKRDRAYVLATGPSAADYADLNHQNAVGIVCNSTILDEALMDTLRPSFLVFADPIFHFGPSQYAAAFREAVRRAAARYDFAIAIPLKYHDIFLNQLPELEDRLVAVPFTVRPDFSFDLTAEFDVKVTANILTFLMLPLASTFGSTVEILGCDGRPLKEDTYFWAHNPKTQINDKMANIQAVHPGFFAIDYNDYYTKHCELLAQLLDEGEAQGRTYVCMGHSHIPALQARMAQPRANDGGGDEPARPRILVIDSTLIGSATATGQVKRVFLNGWRAEDVAQIVPDGEGGAAWRFPLLGKGGGLIGSDEALFGRVADFQPELIYYRPVAHRPELDEVVQKLLARFDLPLVSHIMDDWPSMVAIADPSRAAAFNAGLKTLFARSQAVLSISDKMSEAFSTRYGVSFEALANGVDARKATAAALAARPVKQGRSTVVLRYTGALADNMTLSTITKVARAVDRLQAKASVRFEVYTMDRWRPAFEDAIAGLRGVTVHDQVADADYMQLLAEADVLVLGYNFDRASLDYIQYSIPNKLPEYLASGSAVLAVGPSGTAAMELLEANDLGVRVTSPDSTALDQALLKLVSDRAERERLATEAMRWVVKNRDATQVARRFAEIASAAAASGRQGLARDAHVRVDETAVVAHMLADRTGRDHVMLDVGAHFGTSAAYFDKLGWSIHCFEPDPSNREKLLARFGASENVIIDPRAVSDVAATGVSFFTSEESTGISGLHSFRDTHVETAKVDVTTLEEITRVRGITKVDFLKIDVEGFDLSVLRGVPWDRLQPDVIEAEFEDAKTLKMGHGYADICDFLVQRGYTVYLSEWHPIIRYGQGHDWNRIFRYPGALATPDAWGNLLAFRDDPGLKAVREAFAACLKRPKTARVPTVEAGSQRHLSTPSSAPVSRERIEAFKDRHRGERCFIMGNGPSLNRMDLNLLRGETVFASNAAFLLFDRVDWRPKYYACADTRVLQDRGLEIAAALAETPGMTGFFPATVTVHDGGGQTLDARAFVPPAANVVYFNEIYNDPTRGVAGMFSLDAADHLRSPRTVTITLLQLAAYMGFDEIYLIGCDTDYVVPASVVQDGPETEGGKLFLTSSADDDPNHFDPRYFGKGRRWHQPQVERMIEHYQFARDALDAAGVRVFNATAGGRLEVFPRIAFDDLFHAATAGQSGPIPRDLIVVESTHRGRAALRDRARYAAVMVLASADDLGEDLTPTYVVGTDVAESAALARYARMASRDSAVQRLMLRSDSVRALNHPEKAIDMDLVGPILWPGVTSKDAPASAIALLWAEAMGYGAVTLVGGASRADGAEMQRVLERLRISGVSVSIVS